MGGRLKCGGLAMTGGVPNLWVVPEVGLWGGEDGLLTGAITFCLMLCVSWFVGSHIGQSVLWEHH